MKVIKQIDYIDGGRQYNQLELLEFKDYIVARIAFVEDDIEGDVEGDIEKYAETVWLPLDTDVVEITENDLNMLYSEEPDEPSEPEDEGGENGAVIKQDSNISFPADNMPFELTADEIEEIKNPATDANSTVEITPTGE